MIFEVKRVRATALRGTAGADGTDGMNGETGAQGAQGQPGYKAFATWTALAAAPGTTANEAAIVVGDAGTHTDPVVGGSVSNSGRFAWSASPAGWRRIDDYTSTAQTFVAATVQPATPMTGGSQELLRFDTPTNGVGQSPATSMMLSASHGPYPADFLGYAHPAFTNKVITMSVGYTYTNSKIDAAQAGAGMIIEHRFKVVSIRPGGGWVDGVEFHWQITGADYDGYRPITAYCPWTGADAKWDSGISIQGASIDMKNGQGDSIVSWNFRGDLTADKIVGLNGKVQFQHTGNNYAWLKQVNAIGNALLNLPHINAQDHLEEYQPTYGTLTTWGTNGLGIYSAWARNCGSVPDNARLHYLGANGGSLATCTAYEADITASTVAISVLRNTHASGDARQVIETAGTGSASLQFSRSSVQANITWNGSALVFDKPPKLPSFTVSGLPSAATVGAGAQAFCTDETGGAVPVFSDGTNWRRVTDRAIAA